MARAREYEAALRELEALHDSGKIDDVRYEVNREKLLGELRNPHAADFSKIVKIVIGVPIGVFLILALVAFLNGVIGSL